jgi:hypothetical protein
VRLPILVLALLVAGCGGPSRPATAPVTGRVTYAGKPVPLGQIMFYPEKGRPAMGAIGADGTYRLTTFANGDGAMPGRFRVTIQAMRVTGPPAPKSLDEELRGIGGGGKTTTEWLVPEKYSHQESTLLTAEVKPGSNTINFDLPAEHGASR